MFHNDKTDIAALSKETEEMAALNQLFVEAAAHSGLFSDQELLTFVLPKVDTPPMSGLLEEEKILVQGVLPIPAAAEPVPSKEKLKRNRDNESSQSKRPRKPKSITGRKFFLDTNDRELVPLELVQFRDDNNKLCVIHNGKTRMIASEATWVKTRRRYGKDLKQYVPHDAVLEHRVDGDYYQGHKVVVLNDVYNARRSIHRNGIYKPYADRNSSVLFQGAEKKQRREPDILSDRKLGI